MFGYTGIEDVFPQKRLTCSTIFKQITNIRVTFEQIHPDPMMLGPPTLSREHVANTRHQATSCYPVTTCRKPRAQ